MAGMERFALLLVSGRGVPCKDHKRAVQLMHHALSHISSGQSKVRGAQALLKQLVLSYRILFVRLCDFIVDRLSFTTVRYAVARIANRIKLLNTHDRMYQTESLKGSAKGPGEENEVEVGSSNESDRFLKSAITFPTMRYLSEESTTAAATTTAAAAAGNIDTEKSSAIKIVSLTSEKRTQGQGQGHGQGQGQGYGQGQGQGQEHGQTQGQRISAAKAREDDWSKWRRLGRTVDSKESVSEPVTSADQSAHSHSHSAKSK